MRHFHGLIFFGNDSELLIQLLRGKLDEAMELACCLQQPPHSNSEQEAIAAEKAREEIKVQLEDTIHDIAAALLGKEITIGKQLPYPPDPCNGTVKV
jgi:hypothetical protein